MLFAWYPLLTRCAAFFQKVSVAMPKKLAPNASFRDVALTLADPRKFLGGVYQAMRAFKREHGSAIARIGVTGMGVMPNFRVENADGSKKLAHDGVSFKSFPEAGTHDGNWSTATSTIEEVEALAQEQRVIAQRRSR